MNWRELKISNDDGHGDNLGDVVDRRQHGDTLTASVVLAADGSISEWPQVLVFAGEEPTHEIPHGVDWSGFAEAIGR